MLNLGRHVVGVVLLLLLQNPAFYEGQGFLLGWLGAVVMMTAMAALVTGLLWLFFTKRITGQADKVFIRVLWVLAVVTLIGQWGILRQFNAWLAVQQSQTSAYGTRAVQGPSESTPGEEEEEALLRPLLTEAVNRYPFLGSRPPQKNDKLQDELVDLWVGYEQQGHQAHVALQLALRQLEPALEQRLHTYHSNVPVHTAASAPQQGQTAAKANVGSEAALDADLLNPPQVADSGGCVIKPVMTDKDLARCRR